MEQTILIFSGESFNFDPPPPKVSSIEYKVMISIKKYYNRMAQNLVVRSRKLVKCQSIQFYLFFHHLIPVDTWVFLASPTPNSLQTSVFQMLLYLIDKSVYWEMCLMFTELAATVPELISLD